MKLKHTYEVMELDDEYVAVPIQEGTEFMNNVIRMNGTAAEIFKAFQTDTTEAAVLDTLVRKYTETPAEEIRGFLHEYIGELKDKELLDI